MKFRAQLILIVAFVFVILPSNYLKPKDRMAAGRLEMWEKWERFHMPCHCSMNSAHVICNCQVNCVDRNQLPLSRGSDFCRCRCCGSDSVNLLKAIKCHGVFKRRLRGHVKHARKTTKQAANFACAQRTHCPLPRETIVWYIFRSLNGK